ncbi:MAG TPA: SIR2 family protein [Pseudomonadales bacterium]|nr:SIR2 family protein [Pseudomonadales bacterium]
MTMSTQAMRNREAFIREIGKELEQENVAIFAGSGLSAPAGFVSWGGLLRPIARDLGLDVDKEHDLVTLAQYHLNENVANRNQLNKRLIEEFSKSAEITENHQILARLPIYTYWTTNYDKLIEKSLEATGKIPDVKYTKKHLSLTKPKRDAIVYKMHGDIDHPDEAVLTKDDYESYHVKMDQFITALSGDLVSKTFIFIGFSFTDPNLDYILSRVRVSYDKSQRTHYCFIKSISRDQGEEDADYSYRVRKQELFCGDLNRFNIKAILVDNYSDITEILKMIERKNRQKSIFISGAAHEYGAWGSEEAQNFIHNLSQDIIKANYKIVSGFGLGVGSAVISGSLEQIYMNPRSSKVDQLVLRPFPQNVFGKIDRKEVWRRYRKDMISYAGVAIFLFGNKIQDGSVVKSDGMRQEFDIAKESGLVLLPIGATGYVSQELWGEAKEDVQRVFDGCQEILDLYDLIGDRRTSPDQIIKSIICLLSKLN